MPFSPLIFPYALICSLTVENSYRPVSNYGQTPVCKVKFLLIAGSFSFIKILPADLLIMPDKILNVVDLPAPLGPSNPNIYFFLTPKFIFFKASNPFGYVFETFNTLNILSWVAPFLISLASFFKSAIEVSSWALY